MTDHEVREGLRSLLGPAKVLSDKELLEKRSHDFWLLDLQRRLHGAEIQNLPSCVVLPENDADVCAAICFANRNSVPIVPYGAGSGVCGGARPNRGAIVLDMRNMDQVVGINDLALTVTVQPGVLGKDLEAHLNQAGYSMGHFPQSMNLSSVGGWVATRASGQFSTKYGGIENMLVCFRGVLPDGSPVSTQNSPRSATGPSVNQMVLGSEGTLVVLTELTFRVHPLPEKQTMTAFRFRSFFTGLECLRTIMRQGWTPALLRLYDGSESRRHFSQWQKKSDDCLLLILTEGPAALADVELAACSQVCYENRADDLGEEPVKHWLEKRFHVPDLQSLALDKGIVFDTIEISANWDRIGSIYENAIASLNQIPGVVNASGHSSHSYQQGTCIYFTFAVKKPLWLVRQVGRHIAGLGSFASPGDLEAVEDSYRQGWEAVMNATVSGGGTISHHHGIGKVRLPWIKDELALSYPVLRALKSALDPKGILNPGTLLS